MIAIDFTLKPDDLGERIHYLWDLSAVKILSLEKTFDPAKGSPVFTKEGIYTSQGWTDWTQGFQFGSEILQFDATGEESFLESARSKTIAYMAPHVSHFGVHDHGFNNISTYGNFLRLMNEGKIPEDRWERRFYELALKCSGAVQAKRWTPIADGGGYIYSFNGPHSLFIDTMRSLRSLGRAHLLGHVMKDEHDKEISLLERLVKHAATTARYSVYYGEERDVYDRWGRVAHECIFNIEDGHYRCPNSQQGYSPFSTWTRGLAWAILGFTEQLEFLELLGDSELAVLGGRRRIRDFMLRAAKATADFYIANTPSDGIPYWDTGAPNLHKIDRYLEKPADPFNGYEPVDSSAAAITAQGLLRLGHYLKNENKTDDAKRYWQAGLTTVKTLLSEPYLSTDENHQGLILHSVYHRPRGWDMIPEGCTIPCGESTMWGDYHARETALYLQRTMQNETHLTF